MTRLHLLKQITLWVGLAVHFLLAGCTPNLISTNVPIPPASTVMTQTPFPVSTLRPSPSLAEVSRTVALSPTALPSNTPEPARRVSSPTLTPTLAPTQLEKETIAVCENGYEPLSIQDIEGIEGIIFYTNFTGTLYTVSGNPVIVEQVLLPFDGMNSYEFSPDGAWAVIYSGYPEPNKGLQSYTFYLAAKNGEVETISVKSDEVYNLIPDHIDESYSLLVWKFEWMNAHIIKIFFGYNVGTGPIHGAYRYYDIYTRDWWDDAFAVLPLWDKYFGWSQISPDLTRVLYVNKNFEIVLYDLEQNKELWKAPAGKWGHFQSSAQWTRDSQWAAFLTATDKRDIQVVSRDGDVVKKVKKLTFSATQQFYPGVVHYEWSPKSDALAVGGSIRDSQNDSSQKVFYIYDLRQESITYWCPTAQMDETMYYSKLLYAPDSTKVITGFIRNNPVQFRLFDLARGNVYLVEDGNFGAVGWVDDFSKKWTLVK